LAYLYNQSLYDSTASTLKAVTGSYEDTIAELNAETEASRLWISVSNTIHVRSDGTCYATSTNGESLSVLDNITDNSKDIKYTFYLGDLKGSDSADAEGEGSTAQVIYESGLISPGRSIESPVLATVPSSGVYDVTVTAQGYDVATHTADGGTVSAAVTMIVE
jgi:hypothetical protein